MHGGAADRSGLIHVGDEVCEVNGICVEGKTPSFVLQILVGEPLFYLVLSNYVDKKENKIFARVCLIIDPLASDIYRSKKFRTASKSKQSDSTNLPFFCNK